MRSKRIFFLGGGGSRYSFAVVHLSDVPFNGIYIYICVYRHKDQSMKNTLQKSNVMFVRRCMQPNCRKGNYNSRLS